MSFLKSVSPVSRKAGAFAADMTALRALTWQLSKSLPPRPKRSKRNFMIALHRAFTGYAHFQQGRPFRSKDQLWVQLRKMVPDPGTHHDLACSYFGYFCDRLDSEDHPSHTPLSKPPLQDVLFRFTPFCSASPPFLLFYIIC